MNLSDEGKKMLGKAVDANNARLCQNCDKFRMCKMYDRVASSIIGLFGEDEPPYDPNFLAERCDEFKHKALVQSQGDKFWTT